MKKQYKNKVVVNMACNSTLGNLPDDTWSNVLGGLMCVITATASVENFIVLLVLQRFKTLHTASNKILASLAMSDFLTGAILAPLHAAQYLNKDILMNCTMEDVRRYISTVLIGASTFNLGLISCDRCLHLIKLQDYKLEKKVLYPAIAFCWVVPILLPFLRKIGKTEHVYSVTLITIGTIILTIIVVSYLGVIISLKAYAKRYSKRMRQTAILNEKRAGNTVVIIITLYIIMIVPVFLHFGLKSTKSFDKYFLAKSYNIGMILAIANSSINPMVYCYRTRPLRNCVHKLFDRRIQRTGQRCASSSAQITIESSI